MVDLIIWVVVFFVVLLCAAAILAKFYERATREVSFVRTGIGGRKVVIDGGAFTFAWFHQISRINMQSTRLEVVRTAEESLITNDRLRVDVSADREELGAHAVDVADDVARGHVGKRR